MQCVRIQHDVAKWLAGQLKTKKLDWGTLAHIPHPQMTLSHDIVEARCCIRVNGSQLKSKKVQHEVGEICGAFRP